MFNRKFEPLLGNDREREALSSKLLYAMQNHPKAGQLSQSWQFHSTHTKPVFQKLMVGNVLKLTDNIKIFQQYTRLISDACHGDSSVPIAAFLNGCPQSCVCGLEWFAPMCKNCDVDHSEKEIFDGHVRDWKDSHTNSFSAPEPSDTEILYELHKLLPYKDPKLLRYMISRENPFLKEYEMKVMENILNLNKDKSWHDIQGEFQQWREGGLLHCVLLAAQHMPKIDDWLPLELHHSGHAEKFETLLSQLRSASSEKEIANALQTYLKRDYDPTHKSNLLISGTLDRLAVLMRVKSNGQGLARTFLYEQDGTSQFTEFKHEFDLDKALGAFPKSLHEDPLCAWETICDALEGAIPPSLMVPALTNPKRATWGFSGLGLGLQTEPRLVLKFDAETLQWLKPCVDPISKFTPACLKLPETAVTSSRLQDVLSRMGEIAMSPEIAHLMLCAPDALKFVRGHDPDVRVKTNLLLCNDPETVMRYMRLAQASHRQEVMDMIQEIQENVPPATKTTYDPPIQVTAWKVEPPSRTILFTGRLKSDFNPHTITPHTLVKKLTDERSTLRKVGGIHVNASVRDGLRAYAKHRLESNMAKQHRLHTVLLEGMACFTMQDPVLHTQMALHSSVPWENEHEDARYAETQVGSNGSRHRDWVSVYADDETIQKCRLDSHTVELTEVHNMLFPWKRESKDDWVAVASTVPCQPRVLHDRLDEKDNFKAFRNSVKGRMLQDLKLLPVRDPAKHRVERTNVSFYEDEHAKQVIIAYAPTGDEKNRIELMAFGMF